MSILQFLGRTSLRIGASIILAVSLCGCAHREFTLEPEILPEEVAAERTVEQAWQSVLDAVAANRARGVEHSDRLSDAIDIWGDSEVARMKWRFARENPSSREGAEELSEKVNKRLMAHKLQSRDETPQSR